MNTLKISWRMSCISWMRRRLISWKEDRTITETTVKFDDENLFNFDLFLDFLQVMEPKVPDAFRWSTAIKHKKIKMYFAYEDVIRQIPIWAADNEEMQKKGIGSSKEGIILALRYETFLDSVYSLCESISRITACFYPQLSHGFREQKKELIVQKRPIDPQYAKILESVTWYDEVHAIRSEATHFLSGFIKISKNGEPGYYNTPKSVRKGTPNKISKDSIEKHLLEIYQNFDVFLNQFGDHFIQKIDKNKKIVKICLLNGEKYMGARELSLDDIIRKKPGICHMPLYQCPIRHLCKAFRATPSPIDKRAENV